jgi:hypothetical protein
MAMQKVHDCTRSKLVELKEKLNEERVKNGQKKLTIPDIIEMMTDELLSSM